MTYPDLRRSTTGEWPPRITSIPLGQPVLGEHVMGAKGRGLIMGWVEAPRVWAPQDLLWVPPGTKALDLAGQIVEAEAFAGFEGRQWVTAQVKKRDRYLEAIRQRVLDGRYRLTAALAKLLGLRFDDGALLSSEPERALATGPVDLAEERRRFLESGGRLS